MRKGVKKSTMKSVSNNQHKDIYNRIWENASSVLVAATGDFFTRKPAPKISTNDSSEYRSERIKSIKGNWNILSPRTPTRKTSES